MAACATALDSAAPAVDLDATILCPDHFHSNRPQW